MVKGHILGPINPNKPPKITLSQHNMYATIENEKSNKKFLRFMTRVSFIKGHILGPKLSKYRYFDI